MAETIYGIVPPEGACKVRLKTVFKRRGNSPVIVCAELQEETVQSAVDHSETLATYLGYFDKAELGPRPWTIKAELQFLGSDGKGIDAPTEIEILYYGSKGKKKKKKDKVAKEAIKSMRKMFTERERTQQAQVKEMGDLYKAAVTQSPNGELIKEISSVRAGESARADGATNDVMKALKEKAQQPQTPQKDVMDYLVQGTQLWPTVKNMFKFIGGDDDKGLPN